MYFRELSILTLIPVTFETLSCSRVQIVERDRHGVRVRAQESDIKKNFMSRADVDGSSPSLV